MRKYHDYLEANHFYHIYNRAIGSEILYREGENYSFFLKKWREYISSYLDTWCYCLIPNHFHFLVQVKVDDYFGDGVDINTFLEDQFKRFFSSYALSFNKVYSRHGSLFQKSFKRVEVDTRRYLITLIHYIHHNPIHHHLCDDFSKWKYSSYPAILSDQPTKIEREAVLTLFGNKEEFIRIHKGMRDYKKINDLTIE